MEGDRDRTQSTVSVAALTTQHLAEILSAPQPPAITYTEEEDFSDLEKCQIIGSSSADNTGVLCVSVAACRIPTAGDYDRLLRCGVRQLDKICENDYSLVYFHHGYEQLKKPSWRWLANCYRSFDRKFKKNIKKFYIVHPNTKLKMVFRILKPLVSVQSSNKIIYCDSLSELGRHVMLNRLDIPKEVLMHDKRNLHSAGALQQDNFTFTTGASAVPPNIYRVFGGSLSDTDEIPPVILHCIQQLTLPCNIREEGLFRRNGNVTELKMIREQYNTGIPVDLSEYCPHTVAAVLKTYLRELSEPLLGFESYPTLSHWNDFPVEVRTSLCKKVLDNIPSVNYCCLRQIVLFLNKVVSESAANKMTSQNLSIVMGPNLTWGRHTITTLSDVNNINMFCQFLIDNKRLLDRENNTR